MDLVGVLAHDLQLDVLSLVLVLRHLGGVGVEFREEWDGMRCSIVDVSRVNEAASTLSGVWLLFGTWAVVFPLTTRLTGQLAHTL